jgi:oxaloacetate decarboxylase gamma subunit
MEEVNLVSEAFKFMALGMGIVFLFLTIMIFILKLQAFLITKFFPLEEKEKVSSWKPQNNPVTVDDRDTTAAITAAIIHYNNQKGK